MEKKSWWLKHVTKIRRKLNSDNSMLKKRWWQKRGSWNDNEGNRMEWCRQRNGDKIWILEWKQRRYGKESRAKKVGLRIWKERRWPRHKARNIEGEIDGDGQRATIPDEKRRVMAALIGQGNIKLGMETRDYRKWDTGNKTSKKKGIQRKSG